MERNPSAMPAHLHSDFNQCATKVWEKVGEFPGKQVTSVLDVMQLIAPEVFLLIPPDWLRLAQEGLSAMDKTCELPPALDQIFAEANSKAKNYAFYNFLRARYVYVSLLLKDMLCGPRRLTVADFSSTIGALAASADLVCAFAFPTWQIRRRTGRLWQRS